MTRTVHFPRVDPPKAETTPATTTNVRAVPNRKNPIESYRDAWADSNLIAETLRRLLNSSNRHGDLQVIRTACRRIKANVASLIEEES